MDALVSILDIILGTHLKESGAWYSYNCPKCAEADGVECDHKGNLEVNVEEGWCHCWKCGYASTIERLIKPYASVSQFEDFKLIVRNIRESQLYSFNGSDDDSNKNAFCEKLKLPETYTSLLDKPNKTVWAYLSERGINEDIVKRFNIGYTKQYGEANNRVVIPSYDRWGELNYWVGRDYTGKSKLKYKNPKVDKKSIVFNEYHINWYEPVTLVEGPFDHIVVPNSIPLLGKSLNEGFMVFDVLMKYSREKINILLDDDAKSEAYNMYKFLNGIHEFKGRVRVVECPEGYDASDIYRDFGVRGIVDLLRGAKKIKEEDLIFANIC